jgi:hypothetical protein
MKQSLASLPGPLRNSLASGSVVEAWVSLLRLWPRKVLLAVAPRVGRRAGAVLRPEALRAGPGLQQRAVHREVLAREQRTHLGPGQHSGQEARGDLARQQPVAVLGEGGGVPDRDVHAEPDEPAEQQVEVDPLHQLSLRADGIEGLQQQGAQQTLRRDQIPPTRRIEHVELARHLDKGRVHNAADHS